MWWNIIMMLTVPSNNICKLSLLNKRNNFSNYLAVCAGTRFWSCVNLLVCGILLAEIFHTFKILFKIKYTRDNDMPSALTISQSCICNHFKIFPWHLRHCLACQCYGHRSVRFLTSLTDSLRVGNFFLSFFPMNCLYMISQKTYLIPPNSVKICITERSSLVRTY